MAESGQKVEGKSANPDRVQAIQDQIAELKKRWPAHSTPPAMLQRLDELEEELERAQSAENTQFTPKPQANVPRAQSSVKP
jgi:hypothetical protein